MPDITMIIHFQPSGWRGRILMACYLLLSALALLLYGAVKIRHDDVTLSRKAGEA